MARLEYNDPEAEKQFQENNVKSKAQLKIQELTKPDDGPRLPDQETVDRVNSNAKDWRDKTFGR